MSEDTGLYQGPKRAGRLVNRPRKFEILRGTDAEMVEVEKNTNRPTFPNRRERARKTPEGRSWPGASLVYFILPTTTHIEKQKKKKAKGGEQAK